MYRLSFLIGVLVLRFSGSVNAQEIVTPLNIPLFLSSNFGELRNDHFHSGLDIKTQGVTGFPVRAVKAGYISRIFVSPTGYGRALYVNHPDGTTSVYGHLDHFAPKMDSVVKNNQYANESFAVDLFFSAQELPVKQGEVIAYSGNSGSSGGPHLHFELRNSKGEKITDPLPVFKNQLKDSRPPELRSLLFYSQPGKGIVNGSADKQIIEVIKNKSGVYVLSKPVRAWGIIGIGVRAYDRMDAVANTFGVKEIRLTVNNAEVYHSVIDEFFFNESRYINSFIDWGEWKTNKRFFMKSFIEPGNKLGIYRSASNGLISIQEAKNYDCEYMLRDAFGNTFNFNFVITGVQQPIPKEKKEGVLLPFNRNNEYNGKGITLNIPEGNLYTDVYLNSDAEPVKMSLYKMLNAAGIRSVFSPLYSFRDKIPLHSYCPLTLDITNDSYPDKGKYGVVSIVNNKVVWLGGEYESHKLKTKIRELGSFTVAVDTIPPVVVPLYPAKWTTNQRISFMIKDDLSDIAYYRGTLDGKFVLFEYDPKNRSLFCNYDAKRMKKGRQTLILTVRDGAKNETRRSYEVVF